jgi:hypothetical protein
LPWAELGETYEIELVQHFDDRFDDDPNMPDVYERYSSHEQTCGQGFDLEPGDAVKMVAARLQDIHNIPECPKCAYIRTTASVSGVSRTYSIEGSFWFDMGDPIFADIFQAKIGDNCQGLYWIGIMPVSPYFIKYSEEYVATDHMLFREFIEEETEPCRRLGSEISAKIGGCWDSWAVRIRNSSGNLLTRDLPRPDGSVAVTSDAGLSDEDAG